MIDLHCHLDLYNDPKAVIKRAHDAGIYVLSVTTTPKAWLGTKKLAENCPRIKTALGLHPQIVHERHHEIELFEKLLPHVQYVGEIGLDGGKEYKQYLDIQIKTFSKIIELVSLSGGKIMTLHTRQAVNETLSILEKYPQAGPAILHWFTGTKKELTQAINMDCWFSIGPGMVKSEKGRELISAMPLKKILLETDGPFTKNSRGSPFEPIDTPNLIKDIADLKGHREDFIREAILHNLKMLTAFNNQNLDA